MTSNFHKNLLGTLILLSIYTYIYFTFDCICLNKLPTTLYKKGRFTVKPNKKNYSNGFTYNFSSFKSFSLVLLYNCISEFLSRHTPSLLPTRFEVIRLTTPL